MTNERFAEVIDRDATGAFLLMDGATAWRMLLLTGVVRVGDRLVGDTREGCCSWFNTDHFGVASGLVSGNVSHAPD